MNAAGHLVYSAIYGGYDEPKPLPAGLDCPAVMFTDSEDTAAAAGDLGWLPFVVRHGIATRNGNPAKTGPMLAHKYWKTHPVRALTAVGYTEDQCCLRVALWVDGSLAIQTPDYGARCLRALGRDDIALTPHPWRDCAIAEGEYSATLPRYRGTGVDAQTRFYADHVGHPRGWGLFASGAIAWRITGSVEEFGEYWWKECLTWSHQDQVSLPVMLRLMEKGQLPGVDQKLRWNSNLPWEQWWHLNHHAVAP